MVFLATIIWYSLFCSHVFALKGSFKLMLTLTVIFVIFRLWYCKFAGSTDCLCLKKPNVSLRNQRRASSSISWLCGYIVELCSAIRSRLWKGHASGITANGCLSRYIVLIILKNKIIIKIEYLRTKAQDLFYVCAALPYFKICSYRNRVPKVLLVGRHTIVL